MYAVTTTNRFRLPAAARLWLLYALFFVAGVAQATIVPLLPRLSARFSLTATETALLLALPGLATLAVSVPAGLAADRFGARRMTLLSGVLLCVSSLAQATPSLAVLLAGRVAFGIAYGVVWTTGMAWLADLDTTTGGRGLGPSVTSSSVGIMVGPAVGGMLAQVAGLAAPFVSMAAISAAVVVPLAVAVPDHVRRTPDKDAGSGATSMSRQAVAGLLRRPGVGAATGALIVSGAVSGVSQLLISGGLHHLGVSTGQIGLAFSAAAVCYIAVSAAVVRLGRRAHTLRFNATATTLLAVALLPAISGAGVAALLAALLLAAAPRAAVSTIAYSLAAVPEGAGRAGNGEGGEGPVQRADGLVFGLLNGAWAAAMVLMPLLAGVLEQRGGARAGYLAVIVPSCAVAAWLVARSGDGGEGGSDGHRRRFRVRLRLRELGSVG
ncbi:MAG TPA: MFS transporter [Solirubrobacteraceae bacterium]|jgi:MFS family permease|nr:MFS transporter [Solirubrobacteraceae bacterium]